MIDVVNLNSLDNVSNLSALGFCLDRFSQDASNVNNYGKRLVDMCKFSNLFIVNGRYDADAYIGKNTCITGSVLDYLLISDSFFPKLKSFEILDFDPILSDVHCPLSFEIVVDESVCNVKENDIVNSQTQTIKPVWNSNMAEIFKTSFNNEDIDTLFSELNDLAETRTYSEENINNITESVSSIINKTAKKCNFMKVLKNKKNLIKIMIVNRGLMMNLNIKELIIYIKKISLESVNPSTTNQNL